MLVMCIAGNTGAKVFESVYKNCVTCWSSGVVVIGSLRLKASMWADLVGRDKLEV